MTKPGSKDDSPELVPAPDSELLGPGLVHEMRQPLLGIKAGLELIARRLGSQLTSLDDWEMVRGQVARLEELFRSYQQLFTPDAGAPSRFAVEPVVQRAVDLLTWRVRRLGARFSWEQTGTHLAHGSPNALLHALVNLLANALDAVEGGAGRVAVRVLADPLQIRVSDDGTGIAAADAAHIFEARFTTKAAGEGSGLGLPIAQKAMQRAGGDVRLIDVKDPRRLSWAKTEFAVEVAES
ncbi:MAG TPA: HAMP domain-containing sensor histidine kinase [Myxococcales bacterium]|jgi:signal transduction histidine kinase|nr:HAMP domain-containing sensor histidine kinase [Myxococcales bacterium]